MKILNLYAGIGGNRKLWNKENLGFDIEVTAVEIDKNIAKIYQDFFPNDIMIVGDAHQYLLEHFKEYDFIWSSPPCPSHSKARYWSSKSETIKYNYPKPIYPDMKMYEEILFLKSFCRGLFCVENVISYYEPLVKPIRHESHYYWSNFNIENNRRNIDRKVWKSRIGELEIKLGINLKGYKGVKKLKLLRNCTEPKAGLHILNCAYNSNKLFED